MGTPVTPDNITREYDRLIALTSLKRVRAHDMRHTYDTFLHTGGTDLKVISEMMRHRKVGATGDIYVHTDTALQRERRRYVQPPARSHMPKIKRPR